MGSAAGARVIRHRTCVRPAQDFYASLAYTGRAPAMALSRRIVLGAALAATMAPAALRQARAAPVVRMGVLKLIHSITPYFYDHFTPEGVTVEIVQFENPADGKDAVVSGTVDFATFGVAAAILAAVAHQPLVVIGSECNKGMAIVAGAKSGIDA